MKKTYHKVLGGIMVVLLVLLVLPVQQAAADEQSAIDYLQTGSIDDWSAQALVAADQAVSDQAFLENFTDTGTTAIEKRILTLAALGHNPRSYYSGRDLVQEIVIDHYDQNQIGDVSFINDDMWGVLALASVYETSGLVFSDAVAFIVANQNSDGGWSYVVGGDSDTNDTAIAIMALLESGYTETSQEIVDAVAYLQAAKNSDGGWGFAAGSDSDTASTAWVVAALYKAQETVMQESLDFLWSLQTSDGSFKWVASDQAGTAYMTAQSLIALQGNFFPVKKYAQQTGGTSNHVRIEGSNGSYCDIDTQAATALEIVELAATECGYTYNIEQTSFGSYVDQINNDIAAGLNGWMYRVNWEMPSVGAADFLLEQGDYVLWYFGEFTLQPLRLSVSSEQVDVGGEVVVEVEQYDDISGTWSAAAAAIVSGASQQYVTDDAGRVSVVMSEAGVTSLQASKTDYVRSNAVDIAVGNGVSQTVGWTIDVTGSGGGGGDPVLSFSVDTTQIDFGQAAPGDLKEQLIQITNDGTMNMYLEAVVTGDSQLIPWFKLNNMYWEDYNAVIDTGAQQDITASLIVPGDYSGTGSQTGDIVFWGAAAN